MKIIYFRNQFFLAIGRPIIGTCIGLTIMAMVLGSCTKEPGFGGKYVFQGTVKWKDTVTGTSFIGVPSAKVRIAFEENDFVFETETDAQGNFVIEGIHFGKGIHLVLTAKATRKVNGVDLIHTDTLLLDGDVLRGLTEKEEPAFVDADFALGAVPTVGQNHLRGVIHYQSPTSTTTGIAADLTLHLVWHPVGGNPLGYDATTNALGAFVFQGLPDGNFTITGSKEYEGYNFTFEQSLDIQQGVADSLNDTLQYALHVLGGTVQFQDLLLNEAVDFPIGSSLVLQPLPLGSAADISVLTTTAGRYQIKNLVAGQYQLSTQTTSIDGLTYSAIAPNLTVGATTLQDEPLLARHEENGTLIVQVVDGLGTPQPSTTVCCFSSVALWDSVGCQNSLASDVTHSPDGKAVFQHLYPGATYFFVANRYAADTMMATDTIRIPMVGPRNLRTITIY